MSKSKEVLESTTEEIRLLIAKIIDIEKEHENKKNIHRDRALEKQIGEKICKVIEREISK